jgi:4-carboxymuconolactone decarboxylase
MSRRLGALGSFAFDAVGDMWNRPALSRRDRSLFIISVLAAQARDEELELHTQIGLRHGLTRTEVEEILIHVAGYAGFPAAMASSRRIDTALRTAEAVERLSDRDPADRLDDTERDRRAADVFQTIAGGAFGMDSSAHLQQLSAALGDVGVIAYRWGFGEIWARPQLSRRDRSIVVIAILTSLGAIEELKIHVPAGLRHGLSRAEIEEVITHLTLYAGFPRAVEAMRMARKVFATLDE